MPDAEHRDRILRAPQWSSIPAALGKPKHCEGDHPSAESLPAAGTAACDRDALSHATGIANANDYTYTDAETDLYEYPGAPDEYGSTTDSDQDEYQPARADPHAHAHADPDSNRTGNPYTYTNGNADSLPDAAGPGWLPLILMNER